MPPANKKQITTTLATFNQKTSTWGPDNLISLVGNLDTYAIIWTTDNATGAVLDVKSNVINVNVK